ncbi:MAG: hypothetical protein V1702_05950 [Candidatus Woesearchaeota archaeon]
MDTANKPERKFRAGGITATVWKNESEKGSYGTVQLDRSYMDKSNAWKKTGSLRMNDLPKASMLLQKAYEYLALKHDEAEA